MTVVDASVVVEYLIDGGDGARAIEEIIASNGPVMAPELMYLEVGHTLRGLVRSGAIPDQLGLRSIARLQGLRLAAYSHEPLIERAWELRHNLTIYDASYVALAELMYVGVVTTDGGLASVARRVLGSDRVELLR